MKSDILDCLSHKDRAPSTVKKLANARSEIVRRFIDSPVVHFVARGLVRLIERSLEYKGLERLQQH